MSSPRRDCISGRVQGANLGPREERGLADATDALSVSVLRLEEAEPPKMAASFLLVSLRLGCFFLGEGSVALMPPWSLSVVAAAAAVMFYWKQMEQMSDHFREQLMKSSQPSICPAEIYFFTPHVND